MNRLILSEPFDAPETIYSLDGAGNRTTVLIPPLHYASYIRNPGRDQQMNQYSVTPFGTNRYDLKGNSTVSTSAAGTRQMSYDYRDQLVAFTNSATGQWVTFGYDCFGRRVRKLSAGGASTFLLQR